jgi:hypothetical protein
MSPTHYSRLDPQPIEVIEKWGWTFHLATMLQYLARAGYKDDEIADLEKAKWYLERHIEILDCKRKGMPVPPPRPQI